MSSESSSSGAREIDRVDIEIESIRSKINDLKRQLLKLESRKCSLQKQLDVENTEKLASLDWEREDFEWSDELRAKLKTVFGLDEFRPKQLSAMNSTLKGHHAIIVMPTGAGKSLCFQLPALLKEGRTIVVSPLISLMEDQVMSLQRINYPAKLLSSNTPQSETTAILNELIDPKSPLKLLYVTPERLAKSKRFLAKLQKCYEARLLQRIAIDEVHCCSQWGHDFRPDYKFLSILQKIFPNIPILGLTATATSRVVSETQEMLKIGGCLVIRASFNRPNLFYQIIDKPTSSSDCISLIESLLHHRYRNQSGIIYVATIKDCEEITSGLRQKNLKVGSYHANLDPQVRSSVHSKWLSKYYQAIIATVAFGMGIDKPDVRFVLHYSLSKAMESYYQESGRAGRDGSTAECIMMYRFQDIFKVSTMTVSSAGSLEHLYSVVRYCLEANKCRRNIIAGHFDERWGADDCRLMCDRCRQNQTAPKTIPVAHHCREAYAIINHAKSISTKLTAQKLIDAWFHKGPANLRVKEIKCKLSSRSLAEQIIAYLLIEGYLEEDFHFTSYNTISYIKVGPNSFILEDSEISMDYKKPMEFDLKQSAISGDSTNIGIKRKFEEV